LNILTKICVVVLLVLVMFASVTFITMATVPQNWRHRHEQELQRRLLSDQDARFAKLANARAIEELKDVKSRANDLATELADAKKEKVPDAEALRTAALQSAIDAANTRLAELQLNVEAMSKRNEALAGNLDQSREKIDGLQKENRRAAGEITQLRGKLERAERVVAALQRQLMERDERIAELEKQVIRGPVAETGAQPISAKIAGTITAIRGELASINIGSAHGVVRGLKLFIYRDASFVGYLRVDEVDEGEAAGTIVDKQLDPVEGDKVTNDLLK
jgi:predicted nuclease with TOPRIM domain